MNILFLAHRIPYPPNKGEKIRAFNILSHLAKTHTVHLGCFVDDARDFEHAATLCELVKGECQFIPLNKSIAMARMAGAMTTGGPLTTSYFASKRLDRWIYDLLSRQLIDRVLAFSTAMAPFLLTQRLLEQKRVILDMVDVDSDKWRQYAQSTSLPLSWIYRREARCLLALERKAATTFGATLLVSPYEVETLTDLAPETSRRVHSVANGVNLSYFAAKTDHPSPFSDSESPLVMTGTMDYRPNEEGAIWFVQEVLPVIRKSVPNARFYAVGANPGQSLKVLAGDGFVVTGRVDDVRPYLAHSHAVIAPLRMARGVQNKVLEGMAMQKPVVATSQATRALGVSAGVELWIADGPLEFARAVVEAMTSPQREQIAQKARWYVEKCHNWERTLQPLDALLESETEPTPLPRKPTCEDAVIFGT